MANGNGTIRKIGTFFSIGIVCITAVAGYCDTKFKSNKNEKEIVKLDVKTEKGFDKIERKMDAFSREQIALKVQSAKILEAVNFLKRKAE